MISRVEITGQADGDIAINVGRKTVEASYLKIRLIAPSLQIGSHLSFFTK